MTQAARIELDESYTAMERAARWQREVPLVFEGLRVVAGERFAPAKLTLGTFGAGRLAILTGGAHRIERRATPDASSGFVNIVLQTRGTAGYRQRGIGDRLEEGDLVILDGAQSFDIELGEHYAQTVVQLPRDLVARRHERILDQAGVRISGSEPQGGLIWGTVRALSDRLELLPFEHRAHAFDAVVSLLGMLRRERASSPVDQRFARAMADMESNLGNPELDGALLAGLQGITRRRLERIFADRGVSIARVILDRRLERIASHLAEPGRRLLDLALAWGFNSESHFSRSFKQKFGESPRVVLRRLNKKQSP